MKNISLLFFAVFFSVTAHAQREVKLRNLWTRPQVHVLFEGYSISFTIKDIDKALVLLSETGTKTYGLYCGLDTAGDYAVELYPGYRTQYHSNLQLILQRGVGAFLLSAGHAYIETPRHKKLAAITMDIEPIVGGEQETDVKFYDPGTGKLLFSGKLKADMYNKDLGID